MLISNHIRFLYNGGLDPDTADPEELRQRRTFSSCIMTLSPFTILLMVWGQIYEPEQNNTAIGMGILCVVICLFIQAYLNKPRLAANITIFAFWATVMAESGIIGTPILWILSIPPIAILLSGRLMGILWGIICLSTIFTFYLLFNFDIITSVSPEDRAAALEYGDRAFEVFAVEAALILCILTGATIVFRNAQIKAERKLSDIVHSLKNEVHTRSLAEEEARLSEQAKSAFLAAMGHELRTPLNGVIGASRLLKETTNEAEKKEFVDVIAQSSETLLELVNSVMDLSSLESGKLELEHTAIELKTLLEQTLAPLSFQAKSKGIVLDFDITPDTPEYILGDPTRLRQILINLVGNSIKFTEAGAVRVTACRTYNKLCLRVTDTGIGIPVDSQATLFEPYVQAEQDTTRKFGGSGLGLAIVKKLVAAMNGKITLESTPGKGSQFSIFLPLLAANPAELVQHTESHSELPKLRALIADDNAISRMVLSRLLEKDHHDVVSVANGREAIDYIEGNNIDVVLMDIHMPEMDGLTATQKIRDMDIDKSQLPIIAITANSSNEEKTRAKNAGMNGFIGKPFRYEELLHELQLIMQSSSAAPTAVV
ncbi:MAG: response regulator [Pseudomonadales bacterium]|nr:response regulator [Pseudomonadales bacterium]